ESCVGTFVFDKHRFPAPGPLIRQVHARGVRFMLWVSPKSQCGIGYKRTELLGNIADQDEVDLTQPRVVSIFQALLRRLPALGVNGVKADRGDEVDLEARSGALHNSYPPLYAPTLLGA